MMIPTIPTTQELLDKGYKLVNHKKYEEVIHRYHNPLDYEPTTVYL